MERLLLLCLGFTLLAPTAAMGCGVTCLADFRERTGIRSPIPIPIRDGVLWTRPATGNSESRFAQPRGWGTAALGAAALASRYWTDGPDEPAWEGGTLFDDDVRDSLRARSESGRDRAADVSDFLEGVLWTYLVVDTALISDWELQKQVWLINLDATFLNFMTTDVAKFSAGRRRPHGGNNRSFWSGHASNAATAAGLSCAHHLKAQRYGEPWADGLACAGVAALAAATGVLRVVGDRHYVTDVIAGWGAGFLAGYLLPSVWHYAETRPNASTGRFLPIVGRREFGVRYVANF